MTIGRNGNVPLQVLLDSDTGRLHGVELSDLSRIGPSEGGVGMHEPVQDRGKNPDNRESLRALLGRGFHYHELMAL